jgi:hypothetical protein
MGPISSSFLVLPEYMVHFYATLFLGAKKRLYKTASVGRSVRPHDAITWKTSYVAIASRSGGGRGKLVMSLFLCA